VLRENSGYDPVKPVEFLAIITCVGVVTVVIVSGDSGTNGEPLAKQLFTGMRGEVCIDGC